MVEYVSNLVKNNEHSKIAVLLYDGGPGAVLLYTALIRGGNKHAREVGIKGLLKRVLLEDECVLSASQLINAKKDFLPHIYK